MCYNRNNIYRYAINYLLRTVKLLLTGNSYLFTARKFITMIHLYSTYLFCLVFKFLFTVVQIKKS